jgi:phosphoenolpyruvate-protein phosphotransferase (PTS system enzyme I)
MGDDSILVTHNLLPSDAISLDKAKVGGIAMDVGGKTSHTAILARSFEIPAVLGLGDATKLAREGEIMIVDGYRGIAILDPDGETVERYAALARRMADIQAGLGASNGLPAVTLDGTRIALNANIEVPEETAGAIAHGADGIGLFRSEFLFLRPGSLSSEEDQFRAYAKVLEAMGEKPVTIRTLDIGGDKVIPDLQNVEEKNPLLGWRAIRFCLSRTEIFKTQLRAMVRASVYGNLRIMFPMIACVEELDRALVILEEVKEGLRAKSIPFRENIPVGTMIEIPSAALSADVLARRSAFFSIGTNDLIQYTMAVDRGNERTAYLYQPFHPGVLKLVKMAIDGAHGAGIKTAMCGELAGDPYATVALLGLGLDEFSMTAASLPAVKRIIRSVSIEDARAFVAELMGMESHCQIEPRVKRWMEARFDMGRFSE